MKITVQFFSFLRQLAGQAEIVLELPDGSTVADALTRVQAQFPRLKDAEKTTLLAIGVEFATPSGKLRDGDVLSLMPPLQGGAESSADELLVTDQPIDPAEAEPGRLDGEVGGVVAFWGIVRGTEDGRSIRALEYSAYREMVEHQFRKLFAEAHHRWPLKRIRVVHRVGVIATGEASLLVRVEAGHRNEAFAAAEFLIDQLKQRVPIWKKALPPSPPAPGRA